MAWILAVVGVLVLVYYLLCKPLNYWSSRGVPQGLPMPLFGHNWVQLFRVMSMQEMVQKFYNMYPDLPYSGLYQFLRPILLIRDPELIRQLGVKDFDHFVDHAPLIPEDSDPLWSRNLIVLTGQRWKEIRMVLSPSFTSSKMRSMFVLMAEISEQFVKHFSKIDENIITIEMKDAFSRFTNDVIASTAFGVNVDSLENPHNEFYVLGKRNVDFSRFSQILTVTGFLLVPRLMTFFKVKLFESRFYSFFSNLIKETIEMREKNNVIRPDMVHLMMEVRKNDKKHETENETQDCGFAVVEEEAHLDAAKNPIKKIEITDEDITAQALIFFFAGFEAVSTLMCFASYELALNSDVQQKLIEEIDEVRAQHGAKLTYDALLGMKYLDMVISESLRKWPSALVLDRTCTKEYDLVSTKPGLESLKIEKNTNLWIPVIAIHRDPAYYPEPERFDPERFSDENKAKIKPYTYIPFGVGPRNCIGNRFALLETKALFFYLLSNFEIVPVQRTSIPLKLSKRSFNPKAEDGFWLGLKRRFKG